MKKLKNWDNKTWLSSKSYISQFNRFLKKKINLNKNSKILDIGCGRANIISALQKKYKFRNKPIGIDIVANKDVKKNIIFKKIGALQYLKKQEKYDHGNKLVGDVTQEIKLNNEIVTNSGWLNFLSTCVHKWIELETGKKISTFNVLSSWIVRQFN